jgi:hypothetical protein
MARFVISGEQYYCIKYDFFKRVYYNGRVTAVYIYLLPAVEGQQLPEPAEQLC